MKIIFVNFKLKGLTANEFIPSLSVATAFLVWTMAFY
jgi:hypothetical protein